jgi:serine protease 16
LQVAFSNAYYGGAVPKAARILFPNGNVDPWRGLGVLAQPAAQEPVMLVDGASHHAWTHPAADVSQPTVAAAKLAVQQQVVAWLAEDD